MDINTIRVAVLMAGFVLFLVLLAHTWSNRRRNEHEAAAQLPFNEKDRDFEGDSRRPDSQGATR